MSETDTSIPKGLCQCGCGKRTNIATHNNTARGQVKGEPFRFCYGHQPKREWYRVDETTGCWIWLLAKSTKGYGAITIRYKRYEAHRLMYERRFGPIQPNLVLDHLCRNPLCVNPDHLEPVTQATNVQRGNAARINERDASLARYWFRSGVTMQGIAECLGVAYSTISSLINGTTWKTAPILEGKHPMPCYAIIKRPLNLKGESAEVAEALTRMGIVSKMTGRDVVIGNGGSIRLTKNAAQEWELYGNLDVSAFRREMQAVKALTAARREGYSVVREVRQGDRIVIRLQK